MYQVIEYLVRELQPCGWHVNRFSVCHSISHVGSVYIFFSTFYLLQKLRVVSLFLKRSGVRTEDVRIQSGAYRALTLYLFDSIAAFLVNAPIIRFRFSDFDY